mmetsp:Transcript_10676/g.19484  ORF Transcript_10676/g.19484 Transcript_10676/m.19484 type:complete len:373 (+) Transcript_10676:160-1278(+)
MIVHPKGRSAEWSHEDLDWEQLDKKKMLGSQTAMAVGLRFVLYPNSVIKTHIQTNSAAGSPISVAKQTIARYGFRGLWRGFFICQAGVIPAHSVYVTSLEFSKTHITRALRSEGSKSSYASSSQMGSFLGGATASLASQMVRNPTDVIAQRLMIQGSKGATSSYEGGFHAFRTIFATEGLRGLYAGLSASILVSVPFSATFWGCYTTLKGLIGNSLTHAAALLHTHRERERAGESTNGEEYVEYDSSASHVRVNTHMAAMPVPRFRAPFGVWEAAVFSSSAFLSACLAVAVTNPIDLVKTRIQTRAKTGKTKEGGKLALKGGSIKQHLRNIVQFEGWWSLSKGATSRVMTTGPFAILGILVYEGTKHYSRKT